MKKSNVRNVGNLRSNRDKQISSSHGRQETRTHLSTLETVDSEEDSSPLLASASDTGITTANKGNGRRRTNKSRLHRSPSCPEMISWSQDAKSLHDRVASSSMTKHKRNEFNIENSLSDFMKLYQKMQGDTSSRQSYLIPTRCHNPEIHTSPRNMTDSDELFVPAYSVGYTADASKQLNHKELEKLGSTDYVETSKVRISEEPSIPEIKIRKSPLDHDRNWQCTKSSIKERLSFMFNNELLADVHFVMMMGKEPGQEKIVIPAHRFVLSISSSVFDAMFNGQLSNPYLEDVTIEITDIEPGAFLNLLRFFYTDQVTLCPETVMATLYAAKKYAAGLLEFACVDYLKKNLNGENACMLLAQARLFDEPQLATLCLEVIDHSTLEAVSAESFTEIDCETLCTILQRDSLEIRESNLYSAVVRWAQVESSRCNIPATPENQRKVLDKSLSLIRFPLMTVEEFASGPAQSSLLSDKEIVQMFLYFTAKPTPLAPFINSPRSCPSSKEECVCRFGKIEKRWGYSGHTDRIRFMVNRKVYVVGFGLYGSIHASAKYFANIQLLNSDLRVVCGENDVIYSTDGTSSTVKVSFKEPVEILPNMSYTACATIQGPDSYYGSKGVRKVVNGKTMFQFFYNAGNNNGTSVEDGQIPELYYFT